MPAVEHDDEAVGEFQELVEILAHQQDRGAAIARRHDLSVDVGDGGEIEPEAPDWRRSAPRPRRDSSRASTARCTLPPERVAIGASGERGLDAVARDQLLGLARGKSTR